MQTIRAFILGMQEFRSDCTTSYDHTETDEGYALQAAYEWGREWAHCLTLRMYDQTA